MGTRKFFGTLATVCLGISVLVSGATAQGNDHSARRASVQQSPIQLSPHQITLDSLTRSAALEVQNTSDRPLQGDIQVQFAYLAYPHGSPFDTTIIPVSWKSLSPHDTVIANPAPQEHFLGRWMSGVPTHVTLAPHQTEHLTVHLAPPPHLPAGEYWARVLVTVRSNDPRHPGGQDIHQTFAVPTKGHVEAPRDTCHIQYRQGALHMGLQIMPGAVARIDTAGMVQDMGKRMGTHCLYLRLPLHLTGNVPFHGMMHSEYQNRTTGEVVNPNRFELLLVKDAVLHVAVETDVLSPGQWQYTVWFDNAVPEIPTAQRLPTTTVRQSFPFEVKPAWAY